MGDRRFCTVMDMLQRHGGFTEGYWKEFDAFKKQEEIAENKKLAQYEKIRQPLKNWAKSRVRDPNGRYLPAMTNSTLEV